MKLYTPLILTFLATASLTTAHEAHPKAALSDLSPAQAELVDVFLKMFTVPNTHHEVKDWGDFYIGSKLQLENPPKSATEAGSNIEKNVKLWEGYKYGRTIERNGFYITPLMPLDQKESEFNWVMFIATNKKTGMVFHRFGC